MQQQDQLDVEVFRAGDYGPKGTYDAANIRRIAEDYDPGVHEAPVTLDHDQRGPAHGWVSRLSALGDRLVATIDRLSPALAEALRHQRFKKRSVELYRQLPATGRPYLKALSFLGAAVPEVKGLADPAFSGEPGAAVLTFLEDAPREETPQVDFAELGERLLRERRVWRPAWKESGLPALLNRQPDEEAVLALVDLLAAAGPPVAFGELPRTAPDRIDGHAHDLVGGADPHSLERHRRAVALLAENPAIDYREALLRTATH